jgi:hypothetical protein
MFSLCFQNFPVTTMVIVILGAGGVADALFQDGTNVNHALVKVGI